MANAGLVIALEQSDNPMRKKTTITCVSWLVLFVQPLSHAQAQAVPSVLPTDHESRLTLQYENPVWDGYLADPQVIKTRGGYYAYGTGAEHGGRQFPVLHSQDFAHWTFVGNALETIADPNIKAYWAPEVAEKDGRFYLYYAGEYKLRVSVADHPAGPFKDTGKLLFPDEPFSIDGHPYQDPRTGKWYLFFAKDFLDQRVGTALAVAPLADDMTSITGPVRTVLRAVADWQIYERHRTMYGQVFDAWHTVEGPSVVFHDNRYYCFYSGGNWQTPGYGVGFAVADDVMGPYVDAANLGGATVLKSIPGKLIGPGHNSVILGPDEQTHFIVYHSWNAARSKRQMCLDPIDWTPEGPRALNPSRGAKSVSLRPRLNAGWYRNNRAPLRENPYVELPLGAIRPSGWLREMLVRQKNGMTGHLDEWSAKVMGSRNGWLGGDGDQWERGPYWIDGLLPLAYILDDPDLIAKARPWVEWAINSQQPSGYFGPRQNYPYEAGLQRDNCGDWWPKMVTLKVLKQYYCATGDQRVVDLMTRYFRYQLRELPQTPLDHWTFWARYRGGDNLMVVYWLYNITGDSFLLDLAEIIHRQTVDYTTLFLDSDVLSRHGNLHCVNLAQGIKEPGVYFQHHPEPRYLDAVAKAFRDIRAYMGQPHGLYGGDETLRDTNPVNGSELCTAAEMMFSLETLLAITGDVAYADRLEKVAFNALPAQINDDFTARQYFQQANQVLLTRAWRNFSVNHRGTDVCFGLLTGYPCCTANLHQAWPKFTQNLWYATPDRGLAALVYAPSSVTAQVGDGQTVNIQQDTRYPFDETIRLHVTFPHQDTVAFPLHLRVPAWCEQATVTLNGEVHSQAGGNRLIKINRIWRSGDILELRLPLRVALTRWHENAVAVERGPLTYALRIGEDWKRVQNTRDPVEYGESYWEVRPTTPWNYGLIQVPRDKLQEAFEVIQSDGLASFPWSTTNAPIQIKTKARRLPQWKLYNESAGPLPFSIQHGQETSPDTEQITLIPYGCTTLRVTEFPEIGNYSVD